jgi:hypothetical protein
MNFFKTLVMVGLVGVGMVCFSQPLHARAIRTEDIPFQYQSDSKPFLYAYVEHTDSKPPSILVFDSSRQFLKKKYTSQSLWRNSERGGSSSLLDA